MGIFDFLLNLIFPKFCFDCGAIGSYLCRNCYANFSDHHFQRCIVCQKPSLGGFTHPACHNTVVPDRLLTMVDYRTRPTSDMIICGKYQFVPEIFEILGEMLANFIAVEKYLPSRLCAVPLSKKRLRWRGFNQTEIIAAQICLQVGITNAPILIRSKHTRTQKDLSKAQRERNIAGAFAYADRTDIERIILVDDVTTTGSTFLEATKALKRAGIKEVWCIAIAQD